MKVFSNFANEKLTFYFIYVFFKTLFEQFGFTTVLIILNVILLKDFSEFVTRPLDADNEKSVPKIKPPTDILTEDDMMFICGLHQVLFMSYTTMNWYQHSKEMKMLSQKDHIETVINNYRLNAELSNKVNYLFGK